MPLDRRSFLHTAFALTAAGTLPQLAAAAENKAGHKVAADKPWAPKPYRRITTEECFSTPEIVKAKAAMA